jgi:hypothetical protein
MSAAKLPLLCFVHPCRARALRCLEATMNQAVSSASDLGTGPTPYRQSGFDLTERSASTRNRSDNSVGAG